MAIDDRGRLAGEVDRVVARADADAVRRHRQQMNDREVSIWESDSGMGEVYGKCFATDAEALDKRLDALAATVCAADPRTRDQRRADARCTGHGGRPTRLSVWHRRLLRR